MLMKILLSLIFLLLTFSNATFSSVRKFDILSMGESSYSFKDVCKSMGKEGLLIQKSGGSFLDCMGELVSTYDFCKKKNKGGDFLRAFIDKNNKNVLCQRGKGAVLSIECKKKGLGLCKSAKVGCSKLKTFYSHEVPLSFSGFSDSANGKKVLNCYFGDKGFTKLDL
jgi:hypothetical protein